MPMSTSGENLVLNWLLTTTAVTRPTTWSIGLHAGANGGNGGANELPANTGYSRQAETMTVTGNQGTGVSNLTFGPCANTAWGTVTDWSLWAGSTCLWVGTFAAPVTYGIGDSATIAAANITFTLT